MFDRLIESDSKSLNSISNTCSGHSRKSSDTSQISLTSGRYVMYDNREECFEKKYNKKKEKKYRVIISTAFGKMSHECCVLNIRRLLYAFLKKIVVVVDWKKKIYVNSSQFKSWSRRRGRRRFMDDMGPYCQRMGYVHKKEEFVCSGECGVEESGK